MKKYAGELKMVGQGTTEIRTSGNTYSKVSVIEIGDHDVRNVTANGYMLSQLIPGTPTELWVQPFAMGKYLMGVRRDGKLRRAGIKPFLFQLMMMFGILMPLWLLTLAIYVNWLTWIALIVTAWMFAQLMQGIHGTVRMGRDE